MKVRTLSARRHENLTAVSIIEPQTRATTTVWLTPAELAKAVSGMLAIQRSLEREQRFVATADATSEVRQSA